MQRASSLVEKPRCRVDLRAERVAIARLDELLLLQVPLGALAQRLLNEIHTADSLVPKVNYFSTLL